MRKFGIVWLAVVAIASGSVALRASCEQYGDRQWFLSYHYCDYYDTNPCSQWDICERDDCETPGCGSGYADFCIDLDYCTAGWYHACLNMYCA